MNCWTKLSIEYANQRSYLDDLFRVYPCIPEGIREINPEIWNSVEIAFDSRDNEQLIKSLLDLKLFPIKDSYVAYLRRDRSSISRNPATVDRLCGRIYEICGRIYEMGLSEIHSRCSEPKETNRQIGPLFRRWIESGSLGVKVVKKEEFVETNRNAILGGSDRELRDFAIEQVGYDGTKGLGLAARFNGKYVIGEAKFLTDFGGHQNAQFEEAKALLIRAKTKAFKVAILDGVLYIPSKSKMYNYLSRDLKSSAIMSSLVLREFLYQL